MIINRQEEMLTVTIDKTHHNQSVEDFFISFYVPKKQLHELRMGHQVFLNDTPLKQDFTPILKLGDRLTFPYATEEEIDFIPMKGHLSIAYEDEDLLIVDKPPFLLVHPDTKEGINTLANFVANYYKETNQKLRVRYIHRLDEDTSGLIIFVKHGFLHHYYDVLLSEKKITRDYLAIVEGTPKQKKGTIEGYLARDRHHSGRYRVANTGQFARTHYEVLETKKGYALVKCQLDTGRTHQIRVHLSSINLPLLGDTLYHPRKDKRLNRQALHAHEVTLVKPLTNEVLTITSPLPKDMKDLWSRLIQ